MAQSVCHLLNLNVKLLAKLCFLVCLAARETDMARIQKYYKILQKLWERCFVLKRRKENHTSFMLTFKQLGKWCRPSPPSSLVIIIVQRISLQVM